MKQLDELITIEEFLTFEKVLRKMNSHNIVDDENYCKISSSTHEYVVKAVDRRFERPCYSFSKIG